jgi:predicted O-methyltransferase YrrM
VAESSPIAVRAKRVLFRTVTPKWLRLRDEAGGMLSPLVYREIYRSVERQPDLDVVEVGGAAGAGSIAIAWAMRDAGKRSHLIVIERCEGGSRGWFGDYDGNLARLHANFERFGVAERIRLFPHDLTPANGSDVLALVTTPEISTFVHDADGRLDRDVPLFWPLLRPGGLVVVDDDDPRPEKFKTPSELQPDGGMKGTLTHRFLAQLEDWGLFSRRRKIRHTVFGIKPPGADMARFDATVFADIVAEVREERDEHLAHER